MRAVKKLHAPHLPRRDTARRTWHLALAAMVLLAAGCAPQRANTPAAEALAGPPRAEGVVAAGNYRALVVTDINGDGLPDVIGGAAGPGMVTVSLGAAGGGISPPRVLPVQGEVNALAVADFDENGRPDVVYAVRRQSSGIRILYHRAEGQWHRTHGPIDVDTYQSVRAADVNGDGHLDIVAANATSEARGGIQVWFGDGRGRWYDQAGPTTSGIYMDVLPADVNGDGRLDLIGAGWGVRGGLRVWLGDGTGNWTGLPDLEKGSFYGLSTGDVNGDGRLDILAGTYQHGLRIFLGDGAGGFKPFPSPPEVLRRQADVGSQGGGEDSYGEDRSFWQVLAVDLDRDGRTDIVASSPDNGGIRAWLARGGGGWQPVGGLFPKNGSYYGMTLADLNADGIEEVCAASQGGGIQVFAPSAGRVLAPAPAAEIASRRPAELAPIPEVLENEVFKTVGGVPAYKVGPGDLLEITQWDANTSTKEEVRVRPDGRISYRLVEDLPVSGMTAGEIDQALTERLRRFIKAPRLDVGVKEYKSKLVRIMGAMTETGGAKQYELTGRTTVLEIITRAGGASREADLKSVRVRRRGGQTLSLNLYQAILRGDDSQDVVLDDGDLIYLPYLSKEGNRVYVFGEVEKPGAYTFSGSEMHLLDAIAEAGGTTAFAKSSSTRVVRGDIARPEIITADLKRLLEEGDRSQDVVLASGDLVYVPRSGLGDVRLFSEQIRPLLELVIWPARVVNDWDSALDVTGVK